MSDVALRFDHVAVPIYDAAATYRFYTEVLELPLLEALSGDDWSGRPRLMMCFGAGAQVLALCALRGARPPPRDDLPADARHYAFAVTSADEQRRWMARLKAHRIAYLEEDHGSQHSVYFRDPNGIVLELTTPATDTGAAGNPDARRLVESWIAAAATPPVASGSG